MRIVCAQVPVSYGYGLFVEGVCPGGRRSVRCREQHPAVFSLCDAGAAAAAWQAVWEQRAGRAGARDTPPPPPLPRSDRTSLVPPPVLTGQVSSLPPY